MIIFTARSKEALGGATNLVESNGSGNDSSLQDASFYSGRHAGAIHFNKQVSFLHLLYNKINFFTYLLFDVLLCRYFFSDSLLSLAHVSLFISSVLFSSEEMKDLRLCAIPEHYQLPVPLVQIEPETLGLTK